ncbi:MAG: hypothetical protein ABSH25_22805 [Syntrophorhabdales bacterium]|jgi:hypothetical protein
MTIDTTFKEFVDEEGIDFFLLDFGSRKYRKLVEAFNNVKSRLAAEEEAREHEKTRAWLLLNERYAMEKLRSHRARRPGRSASSAVSQVRLVVS